MKAIKSVGFDLDGTLYSLTSEMKNVVRNKISAKILEKDPNLKDVNNARMFFEEEYKEIQSATKILGKAGYDNASQIMDECLAQADILGLIPQNKILGKLLKEISLKYNETYLLTSSPKEVALSKLEKIGIDKNTFSHRVYSDTLEVGSKHSGKSFDYILNLSNFPASKHIYFGDMKKSDILPAKSRGMKTVAVHNEIQEADFNISHINEIGDLLL